MNKDIDCFFDYAEKLIDIENNIEDDIINIFAKENDEYTPFISHIFFNKKSDGFEHDEIVVVMLNNKIRFNELVRLQEYFGIDYCSIEYNTYHQFVCIFRKN